MTTIRSFATVALAGLLAAPLSAQVVTGSTIQERIEAARSRAETARRTAAADSAARRNGRASNRIPPGQLPPKGKCRVWIDGVAPGQQPPVTDCATAERHRTANSRVIYGDRESFPGKGKGKFKNRDADRTSARSCTLRDAVVVDGRVINVCRDSTSRSDRRGRSGRSEIDHDDDDDDRDDDDRRSGKDNSSKHERKAAKAERKGHEGRRH